MSVPTCSGASGSRPAKRSARAVPIAPRKSDGTKPTYGSISWRDVDVAHRLQEEAGNQDPLQRRGAGGHRQRVPPRIAVDEKRQDREDGSLQRRRPDADAHPARPEREEVHQDDEDEEEVGRVHHGADLARRSIPRPERRHAVTRSCGTATRRTRAMTDSTTPIRIARRSMPAKKTRPESHGSGAPKGMATRIRSAPRTKSLIDDAVEDEPEGGPAVVEDHHLVDHRQLEVRVRVVERDPAVLGEEDDEPARHDEDERGPRGEPAEGPGAGQHRGEGERPGDPRDGQEAEEEGRLGEAGEAHLPRGPHPLERRAGVERGRGREEARKSEEVGEEDQVAGERDRGVRAPDGDEEGGREGRREGEDRSREENPRRRPAQDRTLPEKPDQVVVGLEERRSGAPREGRLRPPDHAEKERRGEEDDEEVEGDVSHRAYTRKRRTTIVSMM